MEWDDDFGENLSVLWDILRGMPYKGGDFTILRPRRFENIPYGQNDTFTKYVNKICNIFQGSEQEYGYITVTIHYTHPEETEDEPYFV